MIYEADTWHANWVTVTDKLPHVKTFVPLLQNITYLAISQFHIQVLNHIFLKVILLKVIVHTWHILTSLGAGTYIYNSTIQQDTTKAKFGFKVLNYSQLFKPPFYVLVEDKEWVIWKEQRVYQSDALSLWMTCLEMPNIYVHCLDNVLTHTSVVRLQTTNCSNVLTRNGARLQVPFTSLLAFNRSVSKTHYRCGSQNYESCLFN